MVEGGGFFSRAFELNQSSFDFMRLRNFSRFDLFSSFHMRVNCWFLKSSTIDGTAPRLGGNTVGVQDGQSVLPVAEDNRSEENLVHKPFLVADSELSM